MQYNYIISSLSSLLHKPHLKLTNLPYDTWIFLMCNVPHTHWLIIPGVLRSPLHVHFAPLSRVKIEVTSQGRWVSLSSSSRAFQVTPPSNDDFILKDERSVCVCAPWKGDTENIAFPVSKQEQTKWESGLKVEFALCFCGLRAILQGSHCIECRLQGVLFWSV